MFKLHTIAPSFGLRNGSPFCLKLEALLTMGGYAFEPVVSRPDKMPKGKVPALEINGEIVGDTVLLQARLEDEHGAQFDAGLTRAQLAEAQAYRTLIEEHLYFGILFARWIQDGDAMRDAAFADVPRPFRGLVFRMVQKTVKRSLHGQGLGRHTADELYQLTLADLRALESRLAGNGFFFGSTLRSIDASIYGALHGLARGPFSDPLSLFVKQSEALMAYERRVDAAIFELRAKPVAVAA